jgi:threonine dehydratase
MATGLPVTAADVYDAARRLRGISIVTPVLEHQAINDAAGHRVLCKAECLQRAGSFKFRGAYNAVTALEPSVRRRGIVGWSSGNHGQALALAGRLHGVPVAVVIPHDAPASKAKGAADLGATVIRYHRTRDDRDAIVAAYAAEHGHTIIPASNAMEIMAGAGTTALELLTQAPDLDAIVVPVGGGGLAAGTAVLAKHINPRIKVFGVEPEAAAETAESLRQGRLVTLPAVPDTIADGLQATSPSELTWQVNRLLLDDIMTVTDNQIAQAMAKSFRYLRVVVEPSGAAALAAADRLDIPAGRVGVVLSGGSVDIGSFHRLMTEADLWREPAIA